MSSDSSTKYQLMFSEVEEIVEEISSPDLDLDQLVAKVEKGYQLIRQMRERLDLVKATVDKIRLDYES